MALRDLPSVDALAGSLPDELPEPLVTDVARRAIDRARQALRDGEEADPGELARRELEELRAERPSRVINATGVLLHTNLGRAPLAPPAAAAASRAATAYGNLEVGLSSGRRGKRGAYAARLLQALTGADGALVVNNNAAMLYLTLTALADHREVPVSRGELIEIGGSFRLPELMRAGGARLVEVGTTNRTRPSDYRAALGERTALLLKVHPSNYRITGFTEEAAVGELAELAHSAGIPLVVDAGSGLLDARVPWLPGPPPSWLAEEPGVRQTLEAGADLVLFSGDKLLGGPQAGIAVGDPALLVRMARHPVARAVRCDGPALAALSATLELYARGEGASVPFWAMATTPYEHLEARLERFRSSLDPAGEVRPGVSAPGAGSAPGSGIPSPLLFLEIDHVESAWRSLLAADPPVMARREESGLVVDLRTVPPDDDPLVFEALRRACRS